MSTDPRWTDETEKLVENILDSHVYGSGYMASSFTASDRDNATERILTALADAGLLVLPTKGPPQANLPWRWVVVMACL